MISGRCEMISGRCEIISGRCEIISGRCEIISGRCEIISGRCEMISSCCEILSGCSKILSGRYEMIFCRCKMISGRCEVYMFQSRCKIAAAKMLYVVKIRTLLPLSRPFSHCEIMWVFSDDLAAGSQGPGPFPCMQLHLIQNDFKTAVLFVSNNLNDKRTIFSLLVQPFKGLKNGRFFWGSTNNFRRVFLLLK